jgi:hypothetical protein
MPANAVRIADKIGAVQSVASPGGLIAIGNKVSVRDESFLYLKFVEKRENSRRQGFTDFKRLLRVLLNHQQSATASRKNDGCCRAGRTASDDSYVEMVF